MLINIFLGAGALSASFWMYSISWQYGLGTLVLLLSLLSIATLIRKASTTVMVNKPPQKDQSSSGITDEEVIKQTSPPLPVIPGGIDSNLFKRFREKHKVGGSSNIGLPGPYQSPNPPRTNPVRTKTESMEQASFLNELEDTEQVRVTLSGQTKNSGLIEQEAPPVRQSFMNLEEEESSRNSAMPQSNLPSIKENMENDPVPSRMLSETWPAESRFPKETQIPATPFLSVQPLAQEEQLEEAMEDLFADVHVPLTMEDQNPPDVHEDSPKSRPGEQQQKEDSGFWQEDQLSSLFQKPGPLDETRDEARGLLKIALAAADSGREDEARNGLDSYFSMLDEIGKSPAPEAVELQGQLEHKAEPDQLISEAQETFQETEPPQKLETDSSIDEQPKERINPWDNDEQTDYASIMDELVDALEKKEAYQEALPLLQDLLAYNKQQENQTEMDLIYERIEKAQNALEDNEGLLETYESHLQCKRSLDDQNGLIRILDALGTLHSKIGNSERSREFHAERLKLVSLGEKKGLEDSAIETLNQ